MNSNIMTAAQQNNSFNIITGILFQLIGAVQLFTGDTISASVWLVIGGTMWLPEIIKMPRLQTIIRVVGLITGVILIILMIATDIMARA